MGKALHADKIDVNKSALQVLRILAFFSENTDPQGVSDIVNGLSVSRNMAYRALQTLCDADYLCQLPSTKKYILSPSTIDFLKPESEDIDIKGRCHSHLVKLHELTGESVFLSIVAGHERVNIDSVEAPGRKVTYGIKGRAVPLHSTITSKVLLAHLSSNEIEEYLESKDFKKLSVAENVDPAKLRNELDKIRGDGYGISTSQGPLVHLRARYVCFPILDANHRLHGAISIGGPLERFSLARIEKVIPRLKTVLAQLRAELTTTPSANSFNHLLE